MARYFSQNFIRRLTVLADRPKVSFKTVLFTCLVMLFPHNPVMIVQKNASALFVHLPLLAFTVSINSLKFSNSLEQKFLIWSVSCVLDNELQLLLDEIIWTMDFVVFWIEGWINALIKEIPNNYGLPDNKQLNILVLNVSTLTLITDVFIKVGVILFQLITLLLYLSTFWLELPWNKGVLLWTLVVFTVKA